MELLLLLVPFFFLGGDSSTTPGVPTEIPPGVPEHAEQIDYAGHRIYIWRTNDDGTPPQPWEPWDVVVFAPDGTRFLGPETFAGLLPMVILEVRNRIDTKYATQGADAPVPPISDPLPPAPPQPVVCSQTVYVTADGRGATLCRQGGVWRVFKDDDTLLPERYVDPGRAAQRAIRLLRAGEANTITITVGETTATINRIGAQLYKWGVVKAAQPGGVGLSFGGQEATLLDAMGAAYDAAGGI
jgi:hypothetical protein